ncbi:sigma factor [Fusobacterium necrophorum]|uniref:sigma factor n=1 Tax=Fusobacterium necrophorum TaxID=859 RepID=UPI0004864A10|nr:sigma factor [Fusobacterium necrophorum]
MKQREFEELLLRRRFSDEEFAQYLQENPLQEVEFEVEDAEVAIEKKEFTLLESSVLEYIEELCSYDPERLIEEREAHIALEMKKVLYYAFFYLKEGISYMDLVQEGIIGLMKGVDRDSEALDFWIIRELFFFVYAQIQDVKFGFKNFLKGKREEAEHQHEHEHHHEEGHECSCGHNPNEEHECCGKHHQEEEEEILDKNQMLKKLLKSNAAIDTMEQIIEERLDFHCIKNRLYAMEIEVLNYYFGLLVEKRYSIFEIEEKFQWEKNFAQNVFENAIYKLSTLKGKLES